MITKNATTNMHFFTLLSFIAEKSKDRHTKGESLLLTKRRKEIDQILRELDEQGLLP